MRYAVRRPSQRLLLLLSLIGMTGCATGGIPDVEPADIPRLQREVASNPANTDVQVQLGIAQFKATDYQSALGSLQGAIDAGNQSGPAYLYLGMVHEETEEWALARDAYTGYLEVGTSEPLLAQVQDRLQLIGRNILRAQAQQALEQEAEITASGATTARSVAVFPFAFNSDRDDLEPLIYALSDMMITDFAVSNALVVLERAQIQSLLDEMALTASGYAEPGTGARAGRMLRAEHVVQGVLTTLAGDDLQTDADVLNIPSASSIGELTEGAALEDLFDMEKQIVIRTIREVLGVELTPAEEQAILDNRMDNVLAFLAYGRGLREVDRGDFEAAAAEFRTASAIEGSSTVIDNALSDVIELTSATTSSTDDLAGLAGTTGELGGGGGFVEPPATVVTGQAPAGDGQGGAGVAGTLTNVTQGVAPRPTGGTLDQGSADQSTEAPKQTDDTNRQPVQEAVGSEGTGGGQATIRILIQRPGRFDQ